MNISMLQILILAVLIYITPMFMIHEYLRKYNEKIPNIFIFGLKITGYLKQ